MSQREPEWDVHFQRWLLTNWSEENQLYYRTHYVGKLLSTTKATGETHYPTRRKMGILRLVARAAAKGRLGD